MSRSTSTLEVIRPKDSPVQAILSDAITSAMSESVNDSFRPLTSSHWYRGSSSGASSLSCISLPAKSRIPLPVAAKSAGLHRSTRDLSLPPPSKESAAPVLSSRDRVLRRQGSCPPGQILGAAAALEKRRLLPPPVPPKPKGLKGAVAKQVLKRESSSPPSLTTQKTKPMPAAAQQRWALRREASFDSLASGRTTPAFSVASTGGVPRRPGSRIPIWTGSQERLNESHKKWESCSNLEVSGSFCFAHAQTAEQKQRLVTIEHLSVALYGGNSV